MIVRSVLVGLGLLPLLLPFPARAGARVRLIAVQMRVDRGTYADLPAFRKEMDRLIGAAAKRRAQTCPTVVALPEDVGLGLVFLGHMDAVRGASTIREAGDMLGRSVADLLMPTAMRFGVSPTRALLIVANNGWLRSAYYDTFRALARKHRVYLAAGSAPLCAPGSAVVRNVAVLFGPDGSVINESAKVHLIDLEGASGLDLVPGRLEDLRVARTPFGKIGTAVCWDGFHDDVLDALTAQGADYILQPSFNPKPWSGEQETDWAEAGLWAKLKLRPSVRAGVNPMMVGSLWDLMCEGQSNIVAAKAPPNGYLARAGSAKDEAFLCVDIH